MYCCFQETSAAMSFVPGSLAAMLCLPCYCMLLTSRSSRRPAICPLSFSTSARGRKLKVPWRLAVHEHSTSTRMSSGTATTTPGGRRLLLLLFLMSPGDSNIEPGPQAYYFKLCVVKTKGVRLQLDPITPGTLRGDVRFSLNTAS